MIDEIEIDLEDAAAERNGRGRQAPGSNAERHLPPIVEERNERELHLTHDLGPHVECDERVFPLLVGQRRPFLASQCLLRSHRGVNPHRSLRARLDFRASMRGRAS